MTTLHFAPSSDKHWEQERRLNREGGVGGGGGGGGRRKSLFEGKSLNSSHTTKE